MKALAPHWGALLALALFLIAGLAVLDDYGGGLDETRQILIAEYNLDYITRADAGILERGDISAQDVFYGAAFELPLLLVERAFGLQEFRGVYLTRHLLTYLFFLVGGLFAYLLAARLFRARILELIAMLIFLLHPRLYAHAFFNSKDVPFLIMFIAALYLTHRAFRRDTLWAFALLGVGVGVLVNLRIMGVVLLAAIPALRALDFAVAQDWAERKRVILTAGAFALTAALSVYAPLPYLWADPVGRAVEWWTTFSDHPHAPYELFRGTIYRSDSFPADYVPTWFSISSPPFALLLGLIGAGAVLLGAVRAPRVAIRSGRLRFGLLLVGCAAAPVAAVILLNANVYNGWRHMYFLWAPFALLAAVGLAALIRALVRPRLRAAAYGAAGAGAAATLISMALIHPNQQDYFNALVDRVAPERLRTQYEMDYWRLMPRQAVEWLLQSDLAPSDGASIANPVWRRILPKADRERLSRGAGLDALVLKHGFDLGFSEQSDELIIRRFQAYNNTILTIERKGGLREILEATAGREPLIDSVFDLHLLDEGGIALIKQPCAPSFIGRTRLWLRTTPVDPNALPTWRRTTPWPLEVYGAAFDGKCAALIPSPNYPVAAFHVTWDPDMMSEAAGRESMRRAREEGRLLARAAYDIYLAGNDLVYLQESCDPMKTEHVFYADVVPERTADLPEDLRKRGYERFGFDFRLHGAFVGETCVATFALPGYPVDSVQTGQSAPEGGDAWRVEFSLNAEPYRNAYLSARRREPLARSVFDVYSAEGALLYVKDSCDWNDTEARFFLHLAPERVEDLPKDRRAQRFDNLDFTFFGRGGYFEGKCAAVVDLPEYGVASVRTGQAAPEGGAAWRAEFSLNAEPYRNAYLSARQRGPLARSVFDVYLADGDLVYAKERCDQADTNDRFFLHAEPERVEDLPEDRRAYGFDNLDFTFFGRGGYFEGKCAAVVPLPEYGIASVRTGQSAPEGVDAWRAEFSLNPKSYRTAYLSATQGEPLARSVFDVYLADGDLVYVKERCDQADTEARFFLHAEPERVEDLPEDRREHGFDNLDFTFLGRGGYFEGKCAAVVPLPEYGIASVRTGQFGSEGEIWRAEFAVER